RRRVHPQHAGGRDDDTRRCGDSVPGQRYAAGAAGAVRIAWCGVDEVAGGIHCSQTSPNLEAMSSLRASMAASESSPVALIRTAEPHSAASIIMPMILLPLTSISSFDTRTSAVKRFASLTNSAAGRACRPCLFTMV